MEHGSWNILLVDDDEDDYILTQALLTEAKANHFHLEWASTFDSAVQRMEENHLDAVLVDYDLGAYNGLDVVREAMARSCHAPIILLTGRGNYQIDLEAMQAGAADYLVKGEVTSTLLERTIRYSIERKNAEEALRRAHDELESRVQMRTKELKQANEQLALANEVLQAEIIEREQVEAELAEVRRSLMDSRESERLQLSQDLHDGPMQDLYGITYQIIGLQEQLESQEMLTKLELLKTTVMDVLQTLRAMCGQLRPPTLTPFGLEKTIRSHAEEFQQKYPEFVIHLNLTPDGQTLPERVRLALFRIYQTSISNVLRHAEASNVWIRFQIEEQQVVLEIRDDGKGFHVPPRWVDMVRQGHLGLAGAAERAESIGGTLQVLSKPGQGTTLCITVPFPIKE